MQSPARLATLVCYLSPPTSLTICYVIAHAPPLSVDFFFIISASVVDCDTLFVPRPAAKQKMCSSLRTYCALQYDTFTSAERQRQHQRGTGGTIPRQVALLYVVCPASAGDVYVFGLSLPRLGGGLTGPIEGESPSSANVLLKIQNTPVGGIEQ